MQAIEPSPSVYAGAYHQQADAVLLQQCLERNEQACSALLQRYGDMIYSIACRWSLSPEEAARVFQSVWLALVEKPGLAYQQDGLSCWVVSSTLAECVRIRQQRHGTLRCDTDAVLSEEEIAKLEQERLLQQALSTMAEPCQERLRFVLYDKQTWLCQRAEEPTAATCGIEPKIRCCLAKLLTTLKELGF